MNQRVSKPSPPVLIDGESHQHDDEPRRKRRKILQSSTAISIPSLHESLSHHPENADDGNRLRLLLEAVNQVSDDEDDEMDAKSVDSVDTSKVLPLNVESSHGASATSTGSGFLGSREGCRKRQLVQPRLPALPMGRPLAPPPRLPHLPPGYKITSAVIG